MADEAYDVKEVNIDEVAVKLLLQLSLTKTKVRSVDQIAPEEFIVEPRGVDLQSMNFMAHRSSRTLSN